VLAIAGSVPVTIGVVTLPPPPGLAGGVAAFLHDCIAVNEAKIINAAFVFMFFMFDAFCLNMILKISWINKI
jgi:hypothetical protein